MAIQSKLSPEEDKLIKELMSESFYRRAMPCAIASMSGAFYALHKGVLKGHGKYGRAVTISGAGVAGFILGKMSYIPTMKQQILERLPNSSLARQIRGENPLNTNSPNQSPADLAPKAKLFEEQPQLKGLDDFNRPSMDRDVTVHQDPSASQRSVTYDELRRRNRESAEEQRPRQSTGEKLDPSAPQSATTYDELRRRNREQAEGPTPRQPQTYSDDPRPSRREDRPNEGAPAYPEKKKKTNMWGDEMED